MLLYAESKSKSGLRLSGGICRSRLPYNEVGTSDDEVSPRQFTRSPYGGFGQHGQYRRSDGKGHSFDVQGSLPDNFRAYEDAVKRKEVRIGHMFVTENRTFDGPKWLINFPTKKHWRQPSRLQWIVEGLEDLGRVVEQKGIRSMALPPLGCGNGGLNWSEVRPEIERVFGELHDVDIWVFEPTPEYQNVAKRTGMNEADSGSRSRCGDHPPILGAWDRMYLFGSSEVVLVSGAHNP